MLIQFRFKNFRSFRKETILDFSAMEFSENQEDIRHIGTEKILPIAAIWGANASGKSNLIRALWYMKIYVIKSLQWSGDAEAAEFNFKPTPFLFDEESSQQPSLFEAYYCVDDEPNKIYQYGFVVGNNGILEEWLSWYKNSEESVHPIFYRNTETNELELQGIPSLLQENLVASLANETLVVSLGARLQIPVLKKVYTFFKNIVIADFGNPRENLLLSSLAPKHFVDPSVQQAVVQYLASFDSSIKGFQVEKIPSQTGSGGRLKIEAIHHKNGTNDTMAIPLEEESAGTLKMFALYQRFQDVLTNGGVLLIDELNGKLHPILVRQILIQFLDVEKNKHNAQLIFTTHDTMNLEDGLLRRDEIWFTEKEKNGESILYSLADFKDEDNIPNSTILKYLRGNYGAIPNLEPFYIAETGKPYGKK